MRSFGYDCFELVVQFPSLDFRWGCKGGVERGAHLSKSLLPAFAQSIADALLSHRDLRGGGSGPDDIAPEHLVGVKKNGKARRWS